MNIFLNEYFGFCFELSFELNNFQVRLNEKWIFKKDHPPLPHTRSTNDVKMNIKQILINDKWFHNNGTPNSLQHQTVFNSESTQKKTVQSIRLFWAQQYNRIIVDHENWKIMKMSSDAIAE